MRRDKGMNAGKDEKEVSMKLETLIVPSRLQTCSSVSDKKIRTISFYKKRKS